MPKKHYNKYTNEFLEPKVESSSTWAEVAEKCGIKRGFGGEHHIKTVAIKLGIDFSHFKGQAWSKGLTFKRKIVPIECLLVEHSTVKRYRLRNRLIEEGLKEPKCECCKLTTWLKAPIPLELHHVNRVPDDNRIENLKLLCPNCHSQSSAP